MVRSDSWRLAASACSLGSRPAVPDTELYLLGWSYSDASGDDAVEQTEKRPCPPRDPTGGGEGHLLHFFYRFIGAHAQTSRSPIKAMKQRALIPTC